MPSKRQIEEERRKQKAGDDFITRQAVIRNTIYERNNPFAVSYGDEYPRKEQNKEMGRTR